MSIVAEEAPPAVSNLPRPAAGAEQRWQEHLQRVADDPGLTAAEKRWYSDPTLLSMDEIALAAGYVDDDGNPRTPTIWRLRAPVQARRRPHPHPYMLPPEDAYVDVNERIPLFRKGLMWDWFVSRGLHVLNVATGALEPGMMALDANGNVVVRQGGPRHGRPRKFRPTLSRRAASRQGATSEIDDLRARLKSGQTSLEAVLDDVETSGRLGEFPVIDVLRGLPRIGAARAARVMAALGIDPAATLAELDSRQRSRLRMEFPA